MARSTSWLATTESAAAFSPLQRNAAVLSWRARPACACGDRA
jgi:hypothetical protein